MRRFLFLVPLVFIYGVSIAQTYKLYPLFIFSFTRNILWPEDYNHGDFEILVLGDSPVIEELKAMAQAKKVGDRSIKVTKINSPGEIRKCNMLFIPEAQTPKLKEVLLKVSSLSILVITDTPGTGKQGSCINFIPKDGKIGFELNQSALTKQNLKASNEITRLAVMI